MNSIKINNLEKENLSKKEMSLVVGGGDRVCLCGCAGSSSTNDNGNANVRVGDLGGYSKGVPQREQKLFYE